jgi:hypothetical protein
MEAVADEARLGQRTRQRECPCYPGLRHVERGVEARDLGQRRIEAHQRADRGEIVWLMKRRQRDQRIECLHDRGVEADGSGETLAPVDDAVADRVEGDFAYMSSDPAEKHAQGRLMVHGPARGCRPHLVHDAAPIRLGNHKPRMGVQTLDGTAQGERQPSLALSPSKEGELQARGTRIEDQNPVAHECIS